MSVSVPASLPGPAMPTSPQSTAGATPFPSATEGPTVRVPHTPMPASDNSPVTKGLATLSSPTAGAMSRSSARPPTTRSRASSQGPSRGTTRRPPTPAAGVMGRPRSQTFSSAVREAGLQPTTQVSTTTLSRKFPRVNVPPPGETWEQSYERLQALRQDGAGITNRLFSARERAIALEHGFKDSLADVTFTCKVAKIREQMRGLDRMYAKYGGQIPPPLVSKMSSGGVLGGTRPRSQSQSQSRRSSKRLLRSRSIASRTLMTRGSGRISTIGKEPEGTIGSTAQAPKCWNTSFSEVTEPDGRKAMRMRVRKSGANPTDAPGKFAFNSFQGDWNETQTHLSVVIRRPPGGTLKSTRVRSPRSSMSKSKRTLPGKSKTNRSSLSKSKKGTGKSKVSTIKSKSKSKAGKGKKSGRKSGGISKRSSISKKSSKVGASVRTTATTGNEGNNEHDENDSEAKMDEVEETTKGATNTGKSRLSQAAKSGKSARSSGKSARSSGKSARVLKSGKSAIFSGNSKKSRASSKRSSPESDNSVREKDTSAWDVAQVLNWLSDVGLGQFSDVFKTAAIDGAALMKLGSDPDAVDMKELIPDDDLREILAEAISELSQVWKDVGAG